MNVAHSVPILTPPAAPPAARNGPLTPLADQLTIDLAGASSLRVAAGHDQACFRCGEPLVPIRKANRTQRRRCGACGLIHAPVGGRWATGPVAWPVAWPATVQGGAL